MSRFLQLLRSFLILALALGGPCYAWWLFSRPAPVSAEGTPPPLTVEAHGKTEHELHVLFIGNSYTFVNNMPGMLAGIAASDTDNHTRFVIQAVTRGGIGLTELWQDGDALKLLRSQHWDYVVLQEQSFWAIFPESVHVAWKAAKAFDQAIRLSGARTLLFLT